jgi:hypothetical protein
VSVPETAAAPPQRSWLERLAPLGPIVFALWLLIGFLASGETGDTTAEVIAYANDHEGEMIALLLLGLATPILIGIFVAALAAKMRTLPDPMPRALTLIGGTGFIVFFAITALFWTGPLLDTGDLTEGSAQAYLLYDDFGWFSLAVSGVCAGLMIIGVSLAALRLRWGPSWLAWVGIVLGLASFATIAFIGMFAWIAWFLVAGVLLLWRGDRLAA